ncbi:MAG TPA: GAK system CofD-like protein [Methylophaga aminisulfidivorans]|uniref:GAK system CofD-like protein n=2 Tax=root TaxID=1 RepID=A0A7C1W4J4_9GAMM|nr:GAK system CofD-like protein [Methylophaga aminisulfidivorans]
MTKIRVCRTASIPDQLRISRYRKIPELGPRILFFSGGTALTGLSRELKKFTHNSIHFVSPFDSGGSSAKLRHAFDMPAIGDLRSRLMALADETVLGHPEIYQLFSYRFSQTDDQERLKRRLHNMVNGKDDLINDIANPMRKLICNHLGYFYQAMSKDFDLRGASIGNLILAGGYLNNHKELEPIVFLFSKLVNVLGTVRTITNDDYHLSVELENGEIVHGQHLITGKEVAPISSPIKHIHLTETLNGSRPTETKLRKRNRSLFEDADLICYPPGSFYTSLLANLLPTGVGKAIANNGCPKVFVPNLNNDPEQLGMTLKDSLMTIIKYVQNDINSDVPAKNLLNYLMVDTKNGQYPGGIPIDLLQELDIELIDVKLIDKHNDKTYDNKRLVSALLSLT